MKYQKTTLVIATFAVASFALAGPIVTFDFEDAPIDGDWNNSFSHTVNNYSLQGIGQMDSMARPTGHVDEWQGGCAYLYNFAAGSDSGSITLQDDALGANTQFVLQSIDIGSYGGATMTGTMGGVVQWTIIANSGVGDEINGFPTFTAATTGDLSLAVDAIEWVNVPGSWAERADNIQLEVIPEPSTVVLFGFMAGTMVFTRRRLRR